MKALPPKEERLGYDKTVEDNVLRCALKDLELFSIEVNPANESIIGRWLQEYKCNIVFAGLINELSRRIRNKKKQRPISMKIKETKKGGDISNSDIYCLHIFNKKKRKRKKIRRRIIIDK